MIEEVAAFSKRTKRLLLRLHAVLSGFGLASFIEWKGKRHDIASLVAGLPDNVRSLMLLGRGLEKGGRIVVTKDRADFFELRIEGRWSFIFTTPKELGDAESFISRRSGSLLDLRGLLKALMDDQPFNDLMLLATEFFNLAADKGLRFRLAIGEKELYRLTWDGRDFSAELDEPKTYLDLAAWMLKGGRQPDLRISSGKDILGLMEAARDRLRQAAEHIADMDWMMEIRLRESIISRAGRGVSGNIGPAYGPIELHLDRLFSTARPR